MAASPPHGRLPSRTPPNAWFLLIGLPVMALIGLAIARGAGQGRAGLVAAACFMAVISAALSISWGAEAAQFFISQGLAVALIALLQVMPEFMVEAVIAWAGDVHNMLANATGSNRLLIGLGWPLIFFTTDVTSRLRHGRGIGAVRLRSANVVEVLSLLVASSYYLKLLVTGALTIFDGATLIAMYGGYMYLLSRLPEEDAEDAEDLIAPTRALVEIQPACARRFAVYGLFLVGGGVMALVSGPFVTSLEHVAVAWGVSEFAFIQWVAPFLSEFPEKVTAVNWSLKIRLAPMAMMNMISSTVSQFTLLVGMIPLVYAASFWLGHIHEAHAGLGGLPQVPIGTAPGHDLRVEVFLSWAMTLLGCAQLAKLRLTAGNAGVLLALWLLQLLSTPIHRWTGVPDPKQHAVEGAACILLAVVELVRTWPEVHVREALRETAALMSGRGPRDLRSHQRGRMARPAGPFARERTCS